MFVSIPPFSHTGTTFFGETTKAFPSHDLSLAGRPLASSLAAPTAPTREQPVTTPAPDRTEVPSTTPLPQRMPAPSPIHRPGVPDWCAPD